MAKVNLNLLKLKKNYLFNDIEKKVEEKQKNQNLEILNLGIGDVTLPIADSVIEASKLSLDELKSPKTLKGYGPADGYQFLKKSIKENDYKDIDIDLGEIFVSIGSKYTLGNIGDLFSADNCVGLCDPTYPVYEDSNIMCGRKNKLFYIPLLEENNFKPRILKKHLDIVYLCSPNNPTGTALTKAELQQWVEYAQKTKSLIIFDAAYEAFISSDEVPHSIYEIPGADEVAIEMKSFSKTAGFTSLRCSYVVIPKKLKTKENISINELWQRYINTKIGGIPYPIQKAAEAIYSPKGQLEVKAIIDEYMKNTLILKEGLNQIGLTTYGGDNCPFIWCKTLKNLTSWEFFDLLLEKNIVTIPGSGFGKCGEGFVRFSGFAAKETIDKALTCIKKL
ncbi:MAG: LL-diaminopimelate aminotransferase [Parachlamydiales bacterium]